jgi:uncharacterized membrane protein YvlD (DUF360 family)
MKNIIANIVMVVAILLWVVGVDYTPIMKVLGLPLCLLAFCLWVKWSDIAKRWINE